jgi:peptide/nickel transport system substrate-binding protein
MRIHRRLRALALAAASLALLTAAPSASAVEPTVGGTATFGAEFQPGCLNPLRTPCNQAWTFWTTGVALPGAFRQLPDLTFEPQLVSGVDVVGGKKDPFTLTYHIRPEAVWSDETPVSADDFLFTLAAIVDPNNDIVDRTGYERIAEAVALDAKTVRFVFASPWPAWRALFPVVFPEHVLEGHDFDTVWNSEIADPDTHEPIGAGPFLVTGFVPNDSVTLSRNESWWGAHESYLDAIVFDAIPNPNDRAQALLDGDVDAIYANGRLQQLEGQPGIALQSSGGPQFEHLEFNLGSATQPLLQHEWFREAFVRAIDPAALVAELFEGLNVDAELDSLVYGKTQAEYAPNFGDYAYDAAKAAQILEGRGCVLGIDGIFVCDGTRASVKVATTSGNARRALVQQRMAEQAEAAGIEIVADNSPAGVLFGTRLPTRAYEVSMFAWVGNGDPSGWSGVYGCAGAFNWTGYCSQKVTDVLADSDVELNPTKRVSLVNKADETMAKDLPAFPLYSTPTLLAHSTALHGLVDNVSSVEGPTWNVEDWWLE